MDRGWGAILFKYEKSHWKFSAINQSALFHGCLIVPNPYQDKLLCYDDTNWAWSQVVKGINFFAWPDWQKPVVLLQSHTGILNDDEIGLFCEAGEENKTLLSLIEGNLSRSTDPGIFAEASIQYLPPEEIKRVCHAVGPFRPDSSEYEPEFTDGVVRFILKNKTIQVELPEGIKSFSTY